SLGASQEKAVILKENTALAQSAKIFIETPIEVWQDYLKIHTLRAYAEVLPKAIEDVRFEFYDKTLSGIPQQEDRLKRAITAVNDSLGEAIGQLYVSKYFPASSKAQMEELVESLKIAFALRLQKLEWMSEATKKEALTKLRQLTTKIGYPEVWTDYSPLHIAKGDALGNYQRWRAFDRRQMLKKLGTAVDKNQWPMTPQTVNAYYSPNRNEIVFPAGILQAPFFDPAADMAVNYGAIGAVIGHEISHAFDDQGRRSDGYGMQRNWWTDEDSRRFQKRADRLGAQYATFSPLEGLFVQPELTMGENIGDLGGVTVAFEAYKLRMKNETPELLDGYTGAQRFFMAWAQIWKRQYRDEELKRRLVTGPHSPSPYRTNGVVRNIDEWYDAFDITPKDELYFPPQERVEIW
ncbi:MAG: M13 family metallopeptidase, partial [Pseudomonadota bacterium]